MRDENELQRRFKNLTKNGFQKMHLAFLDLKVWEK